MLYINPLHPCTIGAKLNHLKGTKCYVNRKIGGPKCVNLTCTICTSGMRAVQNLDSRIKAFLLIGNHIDDILTGLPAVLHTININFWKAIYPKHDLSHLIPYFRDLNIKTIKKKSKDFQRRYNVIHPLVKQIKAIFDYEWLSNKDTKYYNAYSLAKSLDRYTCSYCNRSYTSTIITDSGKPVTRPTLDHWFPKSEYPLLRISFFNLVPSCSSCNSSVKGTVNFNLGDHTHPYHDAAQSDEFEFDYAYTALNGYRISIKDTLAGAVNGSKAKNTLEAMYIDEIYNSNISELRDLLRIRKNYSTSYIKNMQSLLKMNMSKSEVYRILFGVVYEQENYHKRPLSKFKKDLLKKLGMLDDMP